ncbi:Xaa-Pro aminopeptidase [Aquipluma nitroreducens]|uniref:Xaa-Pro aminopeptidase n=2 Tax=Aquipluma nitroreducens TaxID=2010828 RepID=A0A5K7S4S4_9BACT|nr:Xaa-Pro aminopeptidase [Aquipluma nitroreducens]
MQEKGLSAYVIFGTDPHMSEYLPERWQTRAFIAGFTGSAGMVVVSLDKAALWTDSRYFLQAEEQLAGTGIDLVKMRTPGHPEPDQWIRMNLQKGAVAGIDEWSVSISQFAAMQSSLAASGITLKETGDLLDAIWNNRPALPDSPVFEHELKYACTSRNEKIEVICAELKKTGADMQIITALDDLAWTFNLRGTDVECNPVFMSYAIVSAKETTLFVNPQKISTELKAKLESEGIQIKGYEEITVALQQLPAHTRVWIDSDRTNQAIRKNIPEQCLVVEGLSIPCRLKAIKSQGEINHIRQAMRKDGVALLEFLYWIENNLGKIPVTEYTVAEKLNELRAKQAGFKGISFYPIVGYKEHGAIVHFHVAEDNALPVEKDGFLLFDSGGQYLDGTTDTTRTIALGELTARQKSDFTITLKGMISLTNAKFPVNTRGYHLDILARKDMWQHGMNYGHGTGHGVGYFLNVHEGPMSIRQEFNDRVIEAGMVLSNEPAFYRLGEYGLRTENMMVCVKDETTEFGDFLRFDTLTLCPIDAKAIDKSLLNQEEIEWLNKYHQWVYNELAPMVNDELKNFLKEQTKPI